MSSSAAQGPTQSIVPFDLESLISSAGEAVAFIDSDWQVLYCNDIYASNLGMSMSQIVGRRPMDYSPQFRRSIFFELVQHCMRDRVPIARIGYSTMLNRWLMVRVFPVAGGLLMMANDASESVVKQYQLAQQATLDPLTQLGNKLGLEQRTLELVARGESFDVVLLTLHRFRELVDAHGYAMGDMALLELASALQSASIDGETVFRISGEEFAVLCQGAKGQSVPRAERLLAAMRHPSHLSGIPVALNGFAGAVTSPQDGTEYELLLKRARLSARDARKGTRGPISSYRPEIELAAQLKTVLEGELRAALDGNQFTLMLQPKFALATTALVGAEALIRWAHPRRGMLPPKAFLDIAHEVGVMVALDQWVLRQSLRHCTTLMGMGLATPISINLSVESLADMYLAERVADALEDAGVPPQMLEVEIPEGALMQDVQVSAQVLSQLHAMGVRISIDDFGTGYSSFAYLAQFPVHALKIDRQFVTDLETKEVSRKVVKGIIRLAHSLALEVVAEGAETLQQVDLLRKMRCDSVQGYALGKPMPWSEFKKLASGRRDTGDSMMTALSI